MSTENEYKGKCFCGAVELRAVGNPVAMGYCHCTSCREWSAGPINAFTLWAPASITITRGEDQLGAYSKTPNSIRRWCRACGGHVLTEHPQLGVTDLYAALIPSLPFVPRLHVNYAETVLPIHDGLPKQRDFPKEMGGSGVLMQERNQLERKAIRPNHSPAPADSRVASNRG
jgi:hypothetical protein